MKIAPLLLASATALETASTAHNLLSAVGHRNATKMEALVQGLVEESISEPAWKFDQDIVAALNTIRDMFVKNIQLALRDAHKVDQNAMNCFTKDCFGGCADTYELEKAECDKYQDKCLHPQHGLQHKHVQCRKVVKHKYIRMAQDCAALHSFIQDWTDAEVCTPESCLCPELSHCHKKGIAPPTPPGAYVNEEFALDECHSSAGECTSGYGAWLKTMINKYRAGHTAWSGLYEECKSAYHSFLTADLECDTVQKDFEKCMCQWRSCNEEACHIDYEQCRGECWTKYEGHVLEKECLEKDRKIDWSATKKIECYVDILLHNYTKEELVTKCGNEECINKAREEDYKHCHTICLEVDHEGVWPDVTTDQVIGVTHQTHVEGHPARVKKSDYLLGDAPPGEFDCDLNGPVVFTRHRGGKSREEEERCTEHLDIDYQVPACVTCVQPVPPVCDEKFHKTWYFQFDNAEQIKVKENPECQEDCDMVDFNDICPVLDPEDPYAPATCFADETIKTSSDGETFSYPSVSEHSNAWAFNRCLCTDCTGGLPEYPDVNMVCGNGAHTIHSVASGDN